MCESSHQKETPYSDKTFGDRNPLKRYLQGRRLRDALALVRGLPTSGVVIDYGAGNGEFCKYLAKYFPDAEIYCFEPHPGLLEQARENLSGLDSVSFRSEFNALPLGRADLVFSLEVFEHLPPAELEQALSRIDNLLSCKGHAVIGVPVEVGPPALFKGIFRMIRRYGDFDATFSHVFSSSLGKPPIERPMVELTPGSFYHLHHLGFDHRAFQRRVSARFRMIGSSGSPFAFAGSWINSEINYLFAKME